MKKLLINKMNDFDYDGDIDIEFYEQNYDDVRRRVLLHGMNGIVSANRDLAILNRLYKKTPNENIANQVRAMYRIVSELLDEVN